MILYWHGQKIVHTLIALLDDGTCFGIIYGYIRQNSLYCKTSHIFFIQVFAFCFLNPLKKYLEDQQLKNMDAFENTKKKFGKNNNKKEV